MQTQIPKINYDSANFNKKFRVLSQGQLKPEESAILTDVYSLMDMSQGKKGFYDKDYQDYYAIYTRKDIHKNYNIKESKIGSIFKHLVELGYLIRKRAKSGAMKLFTPFLCFNKHRKENSTNKKKHSSPESSSSDDSSSMPSNNKVPQQSKVPKTSSDAAKEKKQPQRSMSDYYLPSSDSSYERANRLADYHQSLLKSQVPEKAIQAAFNAYHDYKSLYNLFGMIFNAKKRALKESLQKPQDYFASLQVYGYRSLELDGISRGEELIQENLQNAFRFEKNNRITSSLAFQIRTILSGAKYKAYEFNKYIYGSFKSYFHQAAEQYVNDFMREMQTISKNSGPDIPVIHF